MVPKDTVSRRSLVPDHPTTELYSSKFVVTLPMISTRCNENSYKKLGYDEKRRHLKEVTQPPCYGCIKRKGN